VFESFAVGVQVRMVLMNKRIDDFFVNVGDEVDSESAYAAVRRAIEEKFKTTNHFVDRNEIVKCKGGKNADWKCEPTSLSSSSSSASSLNTHAGEWHVVCCDTPPHVNTASFTSTYDR
jgi:hypothetical protein